MSTKQSNKQIQIDWSGKAFGYTPDEINVVVDVMRQCDPLTQGRHLTEFERRFSNYNNTPHSFAVSNCTNALELSALLCGVGPGDEVIIPAHTFCATAIPFAKQGAIIKWADIDPETRVVSADSIRNLISNKTKAIVVVHLYGLMAEMDAIIKEAEKYNCYVVEDCAQALGAEYKGKKSGNWGHFGAFSFHAQKNLTTLGEGGMLIVKSSDKAQLVPGLRHNGLRGFEGGREDYWIPAMANVDLDIEGVWPNNSCLGEAQSALGAKVLERIDSMNEKRIMRAGKIREALKKFTELSFQKVSVDHKHCYHLLSAKYNGAPFHKNRDDLIRMLFKEYHVKTVVQYFPLYRYPLFQKMGFGEADCPHTDEFFDNMLSFPFHVWMSDDQFDYLIESTIQALKRLRG